MNDLDIVCDRCQTPLVIHGCTLIGDLCDLDLAFIDFFRALIGKRAWWWLRGR